MKYIIGDCHGCYNTLIALIEKLPAEANSSNIIFLGDLVDRGPNNRKVINFVRDGKYDCILGNHEDLMIGAMESYWEYDAPIWYSDWGVNGGEITYAEYENDEEGLKKDVEWMKGLTNHLIYPGERDEMGRQLLVSHAPCLDFIEDYWNIEDDDRRLKLIESLIMWNRKIPRYENTKYFNVFGHNIIDNFIFNPGGSLKVDKSIITHNNTLFDNLKGYAAIDTGCFVKNNKNSKGVNPYRGKLTCLEFPSMNIIQQDNIEKD